MIKCPGVRVYSQIDSYRERKQHHHHHHLPWPPIRAENPNTRTLRVLRAPDLRKQVSGFASKPGHNPDTNPDTSPPCSSIRCRVSATWSDLPCSRRI